jgi:plastocyanin
MTPAYTPGRTRRTVQLAVVAIVGAGLLAACSSSSSPSGGDSSTGSAATGNTVAVKGFAFSPKSLSVDKGTTVTWKFGDSVAHNVDSTNNAFPKSKDLTSGGTYSFTFNTPGTYNYICSIHTYMKGSVTVK